MLLDLCKASELCGTEFGGYAKWLFRNFLEDSYLMSSVFLTSDYSRSFLRTRVAVRKEADRLVSAIEGLSPLSVVEDIYANSRLDGLTLSKGRGALRGLSFLESLAFSGRVDLLLWSATKCPAALSIAGGWTTLPGLAKKANAAELEQAVHYKNVLEAVQVRRAALERLRPLARAWLKTKR
jgi:hypothetical protein